MVLMHATLLFGSETWVATPPHCSKLGGVSPPCGLVPHGEAPTTPHGQGLLYPPPPPAGRFSEVGGSIVDDGVHSTETYYGCILHRYTDNSRSFIRCGGMARGKCG